jgi:quercetin dioxygenase-like cupin family protein
MIVNYRSARVSQPVPGIVRRILAHSSRVMLTEHRLEKGAILPIHKHPHEQLVYVLSGEIDLEMDGRSCKMAPGDSVVIPSDREHKAAALQAAVVLDIFAPAREDYL